MGAIINSHEEIPHGGIVSELSIGWFCWIESVAREWWIAVDFIHLFVYNLLVLNGKHREKQTQNTRDNTI